MINFVNEIQKLETTLIENALRETRNNRTAAAEMLGLNRTTLIEKMRKLGLLEKYPAASSQTALSVLRASRIHHLEMSPTEVTV